MSSFTSFHAVPTGARSDASVIGIRAALSVFRSRRQTYPLFMKTIALPSAASDGQRTSKSVNAVTLRVAFVFTSYAKRLSVCSRSDVNQIVSPFHIGKLSVPFQSVIRVDAFEVKSYT